MVIYLLGGAWLVWAALNVLALLLSPKLAGDRAGIFTNGLQIVVPRTIQAALTDEELLAVLWHEMGHQDRHHALKNLAMACLFIPRSRSRALKQEHEADDYAAARGMAHQLAAAIRKMSWNPQDLARAERLDAMP